MQLRFFSALMVFIGSYLPLSVMLLIQDYEAKYFSWGFCYEFENCVVPFKTPLISFSVVIICLLSFLLTIFLVNKSEHEREVKIIESNHVPADLMNYVLPYVVSFISIDYQEPKKLIAYFLFFMWLFWITYKSGRIVLNPMLSVCGWRLYEVTYQESSVPEPMRTSKKGVVLSNTNIESGSFLNYQALQEVMIIRGGGK